MLIINQKHILNKHHFLYEWHVHAYKWLGKINEASSCLKVWIIWLLRPLRLSLDQTPLNPLDPVITTLRSLSVSERICDCRYVFPSRIPLCKDNWHGWCSVIKKNLGIALPRQIFFLILFLMMGNLNDSYLSPMRHWDTSSRCCLIWS